MLLWARPSDEPPRAEDDDDDDDATRGSVDANNNNASDRRRCLCWLTNPCWRFVPAVAINRGGTEKCDATGTVAFRSSSNTNNGSNSNDRDGCDRGDDILIGLMIVAIVMVDRN